MVGRTIASRNHALKIPVSLAALGLLTGAGWSVWARSQPPAPNAPKEKEIPVARVAPPPARKSGELELVDWTYNVATGITTGRNFTFTEEDTVITGETARYDKTQKRLNAEGSLTLDDPKHHVTGGKADVDDSRKKLAIITGSVVITLKPDPKGADTGANGSDTSREKQRGGVVACDRVDDYYRRKFVILRGHLVFKQRFTRKNGETIERTLTAEHAEYNGKTDTLLLFAPVEGSDTDGQEFHAEGDVTVGTRTGAETIQTNKRMKTKFFVDESDDKGDEGDPPPATPPDSKPAPNSAPVTDSNAPPASGPKPAAPTKP